MGKRSRQGLITKKAKLAQVRQELAQAGALETADEALAALKNKADDPGVIALTTQISTFAMALTEYVGARVSPQLVSILASQSVALPWASQDDIKTMQQRAHALCLEVRSKTQR